MSDRSPTQKPPATSPGPRRTLCAVRALTVLSVALLVAWVVFQDQLPWWASASVLAVATIAALEAVHLARKAGAA